MHCQGQTVACTAERQSQGTKGVNRPKVAEDRRVKVAEILKVAEGLFVA
jgi:hypothetical protein